MALLPNVFMNGHGGYRDIEPNRLVYHIQTQCPRVQQFPAIRKLYVNDPGAAGLQLCSACVNIERAELEREPFYNR